MANKIIYKGHATRLLGEKRIGRDTLTEFLNGTEAELIKDDYRGYRYDYEESSYPRGNSSYLLSGVAVAFEFWENPLGAQFITIEVKGEEKKFGEVEKMVLESIEEWKSRAPHPR